MNIRLPGLKCDLCGGDLMYFDMIDSIICDNRNGCDRYVVFTRKTDEVSGQ